MVKKVAKANEEAKVDGRVKIISLGDYIGKIGNE